MNLKDLARAKGTNLKRVAEECGIPPTTLYAISRGDTNFDNIGIGIAMKVARCLGITVEELYTGVPADKREPQPGLSQEDRMLISLFHSMSAQGRANLLEQAEFQAARHPLNQADSLTA